MDNYQESIDAFDQQAAAYQAKFMDVHLYDDTYDALCELLPPGAARVLDVGCGPGNITHYLLAKRPGLLIDALDAAPGMITLAQANNPHATCRVMDCRDIGQLPGPYDAVVCGFCLPYLDQADAAQLLRDAAGLLGRGGALYGSLIEGDYAHSGPQTSSNGQHRAHVYYYRAGQVQSWLVASGLELLTLVRKTDAAPGSPAPVQLIFIARKA
ncbi:class I SAM-dependent methyltransferase [Hymenobacter sp. CRA2]|uniref:class I SAM-dependent methyltransferase n=1 Tax=Hymenobacter sp. CRA2 TaxID=1955620 RepID=UPI00098FA072|nr:class I SAM-dependent methyltransferase [Hymenobacter sp. CRA2]OON65869.1 hypothetical protein B0919_22840 [Hymenobacter sp. CRA2]